jgi:C-methyltransferase C-terminal domain
VPVLAPTALYDRKPDYVLLLAWNFAAPIVEKHRDYAGRASRFIVPLPNLALVGGDE